MKTKFSLFALITLLLFSCAKDKLNIVNQDAVYSLYELYYNKTQDKTTALARFTFGGPRGTLLELADPAQVTFDGDKLIFSKNLESFGKEYLGFKDFGTFKYKDLDGKVFNNIIPKINTIDFNVADTIVTDSSHAFSWLGLPVQNLETIFLTIDGTAKDNFETFSTSTIGKTQIILDSTTLQKLGKGLANCTLRRAYVAPTITEGTSKGGKIITYYDVEKTLFIK